MYTQFLLGSVAALAMISGATAATCEGVPTEANCLEVAISQYGEQANALWSGSHTTYPPVAPYMKLQLPDRHIGTQMKENGLLMGGRVSQVLKGMLPKQAVLLLMVQQEQQA